MNLTIKCSAITHINNYNAITIYADCDEIDMEHFLSQESAGEYLKYFDVDDIKQYLLDNGYYDD